MSLEVAPTIPPALTTPLFRGAIMVWQPSRRLTRAERQVIAWGYRRLLALGTRLCGCAWTGATVTTWIGVPGGWG
jgi:hypothetical protein